MLELVAEAFSCDSTRQYWPRYVGWQPFIASTPTDTKQWEAYLYQGGRESLAVAQAVTIGQTFGMLSGDPKDLLLTESFHGTIIAWARQAGISRVKNALHEIDTHDNSDLESSWRTWIQAEESARVLLALHIHDATFSAIFHHEPLLRHEPERLPKCCSEVVFAAPTASRWHDLVIASRPPTSQSTPHPDHPGDVSRSSWQPVMSAYGSLVGIHASISEARSLSLSEETTRHLRRSLMLWADSWFANSSETDHDACCLTILWHETFMSLYCDFDTLERVVGRDGSPNRGEDVDSARKWVATPDGKCCVAHAISILKHLQFMPLSSEPAIHVPLAAFHAGIAFYLHIWLSEHSFQPIALDIPELPTGSKRFMRIIGSRVHSHGYKVELTTLTAIMDLMRRHGHWGISRRFASILEALVEELADSGERT